MAWKDSKCIVCDSECQEDSNETMDWYWFKCPVCGDYQADEGVFLGDPKTNYPDKVYLLSAISRQYYENGKQFHITGDLLDDENIFREKVLSLVPSNVQGKLNSLLRYIHKKSEYPGGKINITLANDYPVAFCKNERELKAYIRHLAGLGLVKTDFTMPGENTALTVQGWQAIEDMGKLNVESTQAFVAMWFDDEVKDAFMEGIMPLEDETGFTMKRVDMDEFNGKICDRILVEIRKSRFLIADVTGHRQGVYFEAGYAMGLGLDVIWTCRSDHLGDSHFDTRQYNHIEWESPGELREKLRDRILATIQ